MATIKNWEFEGYLENSHSINTSEAPKGKINWVAIAGIGMSVFAFLLILNQINKNKRKSDQKIKDMTTKIDFITENMELYEKNLDENFNQYIVDTIPNINYNELYYHKKSKTHGNKEGHKSNEERNKSS
ncbi:hypothetical protein JYT59_00405 [Sphingobacteriaceae bacterium AH-315-L07]|nr:hypothetical protein [Sphingobacteriaceae bacterium AH-315-L07]